MTPLAKSLLAAALVCLGCGGEASDQRLILANVHPEGYPTARGLQFFAEQVAADPVLAPRVRLELQLAGLLGGEKESLEKLRYDGVQLVCTSAAPLAEFSRQIGVLTLPYLFRDPAHLWQVLDGAIGDELLASLADSGFVGLAWYDAGARSFYNRERPIRTLEDLRGLKIRVQKSEVMSAMVSALGASPVGLGFKEVYTNLYTGSIDGAENNLPSYHSERHFEVARFFSEDRHAMVPDLLVVNQQAWQRLSPTEQAALRQAAKASSLAQRQYWQDYAAEARQAVEAAGSTVNAVSDLAAFRQAVEPVYARFAARYGDLVERIRTVP